MSQAEALADWFLPSASGGEACRARINARLHESLEHVLAQCAPHVSFDVDRGRALLGAINGPRRLAPALFGALFDVLHEIDQGELSDVEASLDRLLRIDALGAAPLAIRPFDGASFAGVDEELLIRQFESESLDREQIARLNRRETSMASARIGTALSILEGYAPDSFAETAAVVSEIVPAAGRSTKGFVFDGCSSLERWGAMLLNMDVEKSDLDLAVTIVHEGAHISLFGKAPINFHVENDDETERYSSPLRVDLRPMSGIYHATFVLARMVYAMREIIESRSAPAALRDEAARRVQSDTGLFFEGYSVVNAHARFTPEGAAIMRDTHAYMAGLREAA